MAKIWVWKQVQPCSDTTPTYRHWAEQWVEQHLYKQGLRFIERNYRAKGGECDLLMEDRGVLVFVEVRYRKAGLHKGRESVTLVKQRRIIACARYYLYCHPKIWRRPCRFDVVSVSGCIDEPHMQWLKDAFRIESLF